MSRWASLLFIVTVLACAVLATNAALAVYGLSFWHYCLYGLGFYFRAVPHRWFQVDCILMKFVALVCLASVYLTAPAQIVSLAVVAAGFALNIAAVWTLGLDRTYYGVELASLPPQRETGFPYTWTAHPMLWGNVVAFGGTLLNPVFRDNWWPLAAAHVLANAGVIWMEACLEPHSRHAARWGIPDRSGSDTRARTAFAGAAVLILGLTGFTAGSLWPDQPRTAAALIVSGVASLAYAGILYYGYTAPRSAAVQHPSPEQEGDA